MGLDKEIKNPLQYEGMIGSLRNNIAIRMRGNGIIAVGFEGSDPKKAQDITKVLGEIITDGTITSFRSESTSSLSSRRRTGQRRWRPASCTSGPKAENWHLYCRSFVWAEAR